MSRAASCLLLAVLAVACGKYGPPVRSGEAAPPEKKRGIELPIPSPQPAGAPEPAPAPPVEEEPPPEGSP